ncbi:hypothetical protein HGG75_16220 [Ochrobactrum pseudogrignonense]|nr:hypothetical protein [Brucella pseudogrignonensis]
MRWKSSLLVMALIVVGSGVGHAEGMNPFDELKNNLFAGKEQRLSCNWENANRLQARRLNPRTSPVVLSLMHS